MATTSSSAAGAPPMSTTWQAPRRSSEQLQTRDGHFAITKSWAKTSLTATNWQPEKEKRRKPHIFQGLRIYVLTPQLLESLFGPKWA